MAKNYDEVVDTSHVLVDPNLKLFAETLTIHAKRENEELNALLVKNKKKRFIKKQIGL